MSVEIFFLLAVAALFLAYWRVISVRRAYVRRRLRAMREQQGTSQKITYRRQSAKQTHDIKFLDRLAARLIPDAGPLRQRFMRAGVSWSPGHYVGICLMVGMGFTLVTVLFAPLFVAMMVGAIFGMYGPRIWLTRRINKRTVDFTKQFPDAIDLMVRSLRAGVPITDALEVASHEMPDPSQQIFRGVVDRIHVGWTLNATLNEAVRLIDTPEFHYFSVAILIQRETGGNLMETLAKLGAMLRQRVQVKLKAKALASESRASAYVVGALPFVLTGFIALISPGYIAGFLTDPRLMIAGGGGLCWMMIGIFIMMKMSQIEVD